MKFTSSSHVSLVGSSKSNSSKKERLNKCHRSSGDSSNNSHNHHNNSSSGTTKRKRHAKLQPDDFLRHCSICGDRAINYNYGVICCESCKMFFRRNSWKMLSLICVKNQLGSCPIYAGSRRDCSACRLHKCLSMGMRRELNSFEKRMAPNNHSSAGNKMGHPSACQFESDPVAATFGSTNYSLQAMDKICPASTIPTHYSPSAAPSTIPSSSSSVSSVPLAMNHLEPHSSLPFVDNSYLEDCLFHAAYGGSTINMGYFEYLKSHLPIRNFGSMCPAKDDPFEEILFSFFHNHSTGGLERRDLIHLGEIEHALYQQFLEEPYPTATTREWIHSPSFESMYKTAEEVARRLVLYCRSIDAFANLTLEEQKLLVVTRLPILNSQFLVVYLDHKSNRLVIPLADGSREVYRPEFAMQLLPEEYSLLRRTNEYHIELAKVLGTSRRNQALYITLKLFEVLQRSQSHLGAPLLAKCLQHFRYFVGLLVKSMMCEPNYLHSFEERWLAFCYLYYWSRRELDPTCIDAISLIYEFPGAGRILDEIGKSVKEYLSNQPPAEEEEQLAM